MLDKDPFRYISIDSSFVLKMKISRSAEVQVKLWLKLIDCRLESRHGGGQVSYSVRRGCDN